MAAGGSYVDASIAKNLPAGSPDGEPAGEGELSERETAVVRLLALGYTNKEIATQLGLSVKTVDTYKGRAMEKLGLFSRAALVRYALHRHWLDT